MAKLYNSVMKEKEIIVLGRGGQGAVTSAYVLAKAGFHEGLYTQAFPFFGVERRGAPVMSFCRMSEEEIKIRSQIYEADYLIVLDPTLLNAVNVEERLKAGGTILINTSEDAKSFKFKKKVSVVTADATSIAIDVIGKPFVNIPMLGAFAKHTGLISFESLKNAILEMFEGKGKEDVAKKNVDAAKKVYDSVN